MAMAAGMTEGSGGSPGGIPSSVEDRERSMQSLLASLPSTSAACRLALDQVIRDTDAADVGDSASNTTVGGIGGIPVALRARILALGYLDRLDTYLDMTRGSYAPAAYASFRTMDAADAAAAAAATGQTHVLAAVLRAHGNAVGAQGYLAALARLPLTLPLSAYESVAPPAPAPVPVAQQRRQLDWCESEDVARRLAAEAKVGDESAVQLARWTEALAAHDESLVRPCDVSSRDAATWYRLRAEDVEDGTADADAAAAIVRLGIERLGGGESCAVLDVLLSELDEVRAADNHASLAEVRALDAPSRIRRSIFGNRGVENGWKIVSHIAVNDVDSMAEALRREVSDGSASAVRRLHDFVDWARREHGDVRTDDIVSATVAALCEAPIEEEEALAELVGLLQNLPESTSTSSSSSSSSSSSMSSAKSLLDCARDALALARLGIPTVSISQARKARADEAIANRLLGAALSAVDESTPSDDDLADAWSTLRSLTNATHALAPISPPRIHHAIAERLLSNRRFELARDVLMPSLSPASDSHASTRLTTYASGLPASARVDRSAAVGLVLATARAMLASANTWRDTAVDDALDVLGATAESGAPELVGEGELLRKLRSALPRLGIGGDVSPSLCASHATERIKLLSCVLDAVTAKPVDAAIDVDELMGFVGALRVESRAEHLQAQAMVARVALTRGYTEALAPVEALVDAGHSDAWELAAHIAAPAAVSDDAAAPLIGDVARRRRLLAFALIHCPDAEIAEKLQKVRDAEVVKSAHTVSRRDGAWEGVLSLARAGSRIGVASQVAAIDLEKNSDAFAKAMSLLDIPVDEIGTTSWRVLRAGIVAGMWLKHNAAEEAHAWLMTGCCGLDVDGMAAQMKSGKLAELTERASRELAGDDARDWLASACMSAGAAPSTVGELAEEDMLHTLARLALWKSESLVPRALEIARSYGNVAVVAFEAVAAAARASGEAADPAALAQLTDALAEAAGATREPLEALLASLTDSTARGIVASALARVASTEHAAAAAAAAAATHEEEPSDGSPNSDGGTAPAGLATTTPTLDEETAADLYARTLAIWGSSSWRRTDVESLEAARSAFEAAVEQAKGDKAMLVKLGRVFCLWQGGYVWVNADTSADACPLSACYAAMFDACLGVGGLGFALSQSLPGTPLSAIDDGSELGAEHAALLSPQATRARAQSLAADGDARGAAALLRLHPSASIRAEAAEADDGGGDMGIADVALVVAAVACGDVAALKAQSRACIRLARAPSAGCASTGACALATLAAAGEWAHACDLACALLDSAPSLRGDGWEVYALYSALRDGGLASRLCACVCTTPASTPADALGSWCASRTLVELRQVAVEKVKASFPTLFL